MSRMSFRIAGRRPRGALPGMPSQPGTPERLYPGEGPGTTTPHPLGSAPAPPTPEDSRRLPATGNPRTARPGRDGGGLQGPAAGWTDSWRSRSCRRSSAATPRSPNGSRAKPGPGQAQPSPHRRRPRFGQSDGLFYLLMEFVDGLNLRGLIAGPIHTRGGPGHRAADLRGAPVRARRGHHPPRHQAGEHPARPPGT